MSFIHDTKLRPKMTSKKRRKSPRRSSVFNNTKKIRRKKSKTQISFDDHYDSVMNESKYSSHAFKGRYEDSLLLEKTKKLEGN